MRRRTRSRRAIHSQAMILVCAVLPLVLAIPPTAGSPDAEVLAPGVSVRQRPAQTAPVVGDLPGGALVEILFTQSGPGGTWVQVVLPSGRTGFVPDSSLRRLTTPPRWRSASPGPGSASTVRRVEGGVLEMPLRRIGGVYLVTARINNQATAEFIVDTGASVVTISHALADQLGLDYANKPRMTLVTVSGILECPRIVLDSIHIPDEAGAGVVGVGAVVATLPGSPPGIGGLLGQSFLRHFHVTIDAQRAVMHLRPVGAAGGTHP